MWSCVHYCCRSCSYVGAMIVAMLVRTCVSHKMVTIVANKSVFAFFVNAFFTSVVVVGLSFVQLDTKPVQWFADGCQIHNLCSL